MSDELIVHLDRDNAAAWQKGDRGSWQLGLDASQWLAERGFRITIWEAEPGRYHVFNGNFNAGNGKPGVGFDESDRETAMLFKLIFGGL